MKYVIHCLDKDGAVHVRLDNYAAHKEYLASAAVSTVISGPLMSDDGETMIGSMFIVEAEAKAAVESFNRNDPFNKAGLWQSVRINAFSMRVDNRS